MTDVEKPASDKFLTYRGDVRALAALGGSVVFTTTHPENRPTAVYRLDADTLALAEVALPAGGRALAVEGETVWVGATDGQVYELRGAGKPKPIGPRFASAPVALARLADSRLAVLFDSEIAVLSQRDGKVLQTLELPEPGTCLAADPSGRWLAAGTAKGTVAVFEAEDKAEFDPSAAAKLHEGAVTALLFEADELRFLSAGADLKLLSTHARGKLEPEDKGRGNNHSDVIQALIWGPGDRLYSGGRDGAIKSWPRVGAVKPATTRDGVGRVVALALVEVHNRRRLVAACDDDTLRFFSTDAAGKIGDLTQRVADAYARAQSELSNDDPRRRESALRELADHGDARAVEIVSERVGADPDHGLRLLAARLLGESEHARAATLLEEWLKHPDEAVRVSVFEGLRRRLGATDLRPIDLALKGGKGDVGKLAVLALEALAGGDDRARARLAQALDHPTAEVRQAALAGLEKVGDPKSPEADLFALASKHADVRRLALVRLHQRRMLDDPGVPAALRRRAEDADAEVRKAAHLLSLLTRPRLVAALRPRDPDLDRQLAELDGGPKEAAPEKEKEKEKKVKGKARDEGGPLAEADYEPLLQAAASRTLDTCLRGARGLALLGDVRAFGLLLQLSREDDKLARAEVCRALAALDDARAIERLRSLLYDGEPEVRDAAFSALARIHQSDPLLAAESGLNASAEDVRKRGLQALIAEVRKHPPDGPDRPAWGLLTRALNDGAESVRGEAFKAALNLQIAGGGAKTLRFVLRSIHADVRREAFNEATAQVGQSWGWDLLLEFFNDPDPKLRADAFAFALKKTKGLEILDAALGSRYPDLRKQAVDALVKKHTAASQALLVRALGDEDREVRLSALASLIAADALPALRNFLDGGHADVRLRAAKALATHGDPAALKPLLDLADAPEPREAERQADWLALAESALDGLGALGDPSALPHLIPRLDSPHAELRKQAARALVWVARPDSLDALRQALQHADPQVKRHAALGLAYAADPSAGSLVFDGEGAKVVSVGERLAAAVALGAAGEGRLVVFLDHENEAARDRALLLLMAREWKAPEGTASRLLAALASRTPGMRLTAARGLEAVSEPDAFSAFVVGLVNDRDDKPAWKIAPRTVESLAELLVHAESRVRARTALLLKHLGDEEQASWDLAWKTHADRHADEIAALLQAAARREATPPRQSAAQLKELAFGAYVGLIREQGSLTKDQRAAAKLGPELIRVRKTALDRLLALARADARHAASARPVFAQALGDPNQSVRFQAFEQLQALGMEPSALSAEALASGHSDLGVKGLELLSGDTSTAQGQAVLAHAMLTRTDDLALSAATMLAERLGFVVAGGRALEAASARLRLAAVGWLSERFDQEPEARGLLHKALRSRHAEVRERAALALAGKKDPAAFDALAGLLKTAPDPKTQRQAIGGLVALGDARAPSVLLDRLEDDPGGSALADDLVRAAANFRRPETADRLLAIAEKDRDRRDLALNAVLTISGHDQRIDDPEDERPDRSREEKQFPRRDAVLARLLERLSALNDVKFLARLVPAARWARGKEVDPPLAGLTRHADENLRRAAVEAYGWRVRKRAADREPLVQALKSRDAVSQFHAAEALALAGRPEGLSVLLASVDFLSDLPLRRRAVLALGELADERALEILLKLAGEDGHALRESAAEAIGHLGRSGRAGEIFKLLERFVKGEGDLAESALKGLRRLDLHDGWRLVRSRAADQAFSCRGTAVEQLGHNDDPATRDLLLKLLAADDDGSVTDEALLAARRLWGPDSLEPDYAALQNPDHWLRNDDESPLGRVCRSGDPLRIFEIIPRCQPEARTALSAALLGRPDLPEAAARAGLSSPEASAVALAATILARAAKPEKTLAADLEQALRKWRDAWAERRERSTDGAEDDETLNDELTPCVSRLVWACGRLEAAAGALIEMASARAADRLFSPIRLAVVQALAGATPEPAIVAALEAVAEGGDPEVRAVAAEAVGKLAPERVEALAGRLLSDRVSFNRLVRGGGGGAGGPRLSAVLRPSARQVHAQGVVLPYLVARGDLDALTAAAEDRTLPEAARLGAVEGLSALATEPAEQALRRIGAADAEEDELRKAAWRGLRRSVRVRRKALAAKAEVKS